MEEKHDYINLASLRSSWSEGLLILMYHSIETPPLKHKWRGLYVEPSKLRSQLKELKASGARFVSLSEWSRARTRQRQVVVTFDDGMRSVFLRALPILQELAVPSINYIVADLIGQTNQWDHANGGQSRPLMSRSEIEDWLRAGQEIGSHTLTHPDLTTLSLTEARREIFDSKKKLEDLFQRPVRHFCHPYNKSNAAVRDLVIEAGYETACPRLGGYNFPETDIFALNRHLARHWRPYMVAYVRFLQKRLLKSLFRSRSPTEVRVDKVFPP